MSQRFLFTLVTALLMISTIHAEKSANVKSSAVTIEADGVEEISGCCDENDFQSQANSEVRPPRQAHVQAKLVDDETYARMKEQVKWSRELPVANLLLPEIENPEGITVGTKFVNPVTFKLTGGFFPPDTNIAVGPANVLLATNSLVRLSTKNNQNVQVRNLNDFFSRHNSFIFDPKVYFDPLTQRFFVVALERETSPQTSLILMAVSRSSSPTDLFTNWCFYKINAKIKGTWADFPNLGMNGKWAAINVVNANFSNNQVVSDVIRVFDKSALANNTNSCPKLKVFKFIQKDTHYSEIQPVQYHTDDPSAFYLVNSVTPFIPPTTTFYAVWKITGTSKPSLQRFDINGNSPYSGPPEAKHPHGKDDLNTGDARVLQAVFDRGKIYAVHSTGCSIGAAPNESCLRLVTIDPSGAFPVVTSEITLGAGSNKFLWNPGVAANRSGNLILSSQFSDPKAALSTVFTGMTAGANKLNASKILSKGKCPLFDEDPGGRNRTGDYTGAAADPTDDSIWIAGEIAQKVNGSCQWSTIVANMHIN
jgi:hypothetical protein